MISIRLSPALSRVWDQSGTPDAWFSMPGTIMAAASPRGWHRRRIESKEQWKKYQKEATYRLDTSVGASTEVLVRLEFDRLSVAMPLTTDDFALVWTSKEPTMVRIPLTGVPDPVPVDRGSSSRPRRDCASDLLEGSGKGLLIPSRDSERRHRRSQPETSVSWRPGRRITAYVAERRPQRTSAGQPFGHPRNIVATDKAGNTTRTPVDIPAPAVT